MEGYHYVTSKRFVVELGLPAFPLTAPDCVRIQITLKPHKVRFPRCSVLSADYLLRYLYPAAWTFPLYFHILALIWSSNNNNYYNNYNYNRKHCPLQ